MTFPTLPRTFVEAQELARFSWTELRLRASAFPGQVRSLAQAGAAAAPESIDRWLAWILGDAPVKPKSHKTKKFDENPIKVSEVPKAGSDDHPGTPPLHVPVSSTQICEGTCLRFHCHPTAPDHSRRVIYVSSASYGRTDENACPHEANLRTDCDRDVTQAVRRHCQG